MADGVSMKATQNKIAEKLDFMARNAKDARGFINRVLYRQYQNAQITRWMTEGASENQKWAPLNPSYALRKKRMYGGGLKYRYYPSLKLTRPIGTYPSYPGKGTKTLIATGRLVGSVIGPNKEYQEGVGDHRKIVTNSSLIVSTIVPYGSDVNKLRNFMTFAPKTIAEWKQNYKEWVEFRRTF